MQLASPIPAVEYPISSLPQIRLNSSRAEFLNYFKNSWQITETLFSGLASEAAFYRQPHHGLRHPLIFYYAHPVTVYVNKLLVAGVIDKPVNAKFEQIFEVGVDEMSWDDLHEGKANMWPSLDEVRQYRGQVYALICELIQTSPLFDRPLTQTSPLWALVMGFEHERIHLETSSVLIRELPLEFVRRPTNWPEYATLQSDASYPENALLKVPATLVKLGKPQDFPTYGWDNEYGFEEHEVGEFSASKFLASNGEFLEFVKAGGYAEEKYWSAEGWAWRRFRNVKWPGFWVQNGPAGSHLFKLRTIFEVIAMQYAWPVCVNLHEAKAFCAWKTAQDSSVNPYRLLTEKEHHALRDDAPHEYNNGLRTGSETSVTGFAPNHKGFHDVFGNVWQWCEDHFRPLSGFKIHPYYDDFSTPCFDGRHHMIMGGSFISSGDEASEFARFHFRPHFLQHSGFRIVQSVESANLQPTYESKEMLNKYMLMHYGSEAEIYGKNMNVQIPGVVNLPVKCAELLKDYAVNFETALDLGCAVGRASFEMAKDFKTVIGVDYSHEFIDAATKLNDNGQLEYIRKNSGSTNSVLLAEVNKTKTGTVSFAQGDACNLPPKYKNFDAVLMANILCRLSDPAKCLARLQGENALVKPGGVLVMTTPFSWLEQYTPRSKWLNGIDAVKKILNGFELAHQEDLPFMIREHERKFEYIITHASIWKRRKI